MKTLQLILQILSSLSAVAAAAGVVYAVFALKFYAWLRAQDIYTDDDFYRARAEIFRHFPFKSPISSRIGESDEKSAIKVCQKMDQLARLSRYLGRRSTIEVWGLQMGKAWMILEKTVRYERDKSEGHEHKWDRFQKMAREGIRKYKLEELNKRRAQQMVSAANTEVA